MSCVRHASAQLGIAFMSNFYRNILEQKFHQICTFLLQQVRE